VPVRVRFVGSEMRGMKSLAGFHGTQVVRVRPRRGRRGALLAALVIMPATLCGASAQRPGLDRDYWTQKIGAIAPTDPSSADMIAYLKANNSTGYIALSGTSSSGEWGTPIYRAHDGDPTYSVNNKCQSHRPPEFKSVRIPVGAKPDPTSDASMIVRDAGKGLQYALWHASYNSDTKQWSSCGGTVYYMASNVLAGTLKQSNEPRNYGHRGVPPETFAVGYDEIKAGVIPHLLRIAVNTTKCRHVFPMSGDECGSWAQYAPPEGTIIRIRPSVDLSSLGLSPVALIIALALQTYGGVIGDQTNGPVELKVENVVAEGRGWLWRGLLTATSLSRIPLGDYQVVQLGYGK
jgi:hypothetical protein